jgi:hypothetical protein
MARVVTPANVGPYDDEEPHSCKYCKKIVVTEAMQLDYGDWSIPIRYSRKDARKAAMDGCVFFGLLLPLFSFKVSWPTPEIYIPAKWKAHKIFIRNLNENLSSRELSVYVTAGI